VVLRGSLAPASAIVKLGLRDPSRKDKFAGAAIVYEDGFDAIRAIRAGEVKPGHVLVVRGMGPKGGPGMAGPASMVVFALYSANLEDEVAFVSDGQLSGLCNKGLTVAEVSPEAAIGGPLGLVENGDTISIDVDRQTLDLEVDEPTLAARRVKLGTPELKKATGWLSIYRQQVQPMSTGAVLIRDR
jgi:dihydroxy-acid dehydratase